MKKKSSKAKREGKAVEQKGRKCVGKEAQIFSRKREVKAEENAVEEQEKKEAQLSER